MREQLKEKLNAQLGELAGDILISTSSLFCWGEVEVPELLQPVKSWKLLHPVSRYYQRVPLMVLWHVEQPVCRLLM